MEDHFEKLSSMLSGSEPTEINYLMVASLLDTSVGLAKRLLHDFAQRLEERPSSAPPAVVRYFLHTQEEDGSMRLAIVTGREQLTEKLLALGNAATAKAHVYSILAKKDGSQEEVSRQIWLQDTKYARDHLDVSRQAGNLWVQRYQGSVLCEQNDQLRNFRDKSPPTTQPAIPASVKERSGAAGGGPPLKEDPPVLKKEANPLSSLRDKPPQPSQAKTERKQASTEKRLKTSGPENASSPPPPPGNDHLSSIKTGEAPRTEPSFDNFAMANDKGARDATIFPSEESGKEWRAAVVTKSRRLKKKAMSSDDEDLEPSKKRIKEDSSTPAVKPAHDTSMRERSSSHMTRTDAQENSPQANGGCFDLEMFAFDEDGGNAVLSPLPIRSAPPPVDEEPSFSSCPTTSSASVESSQRSRGSEGVTETTREPDAPTELEGRPGGSPSEEQAPARKRTIKEKVKTDSYRTEDGWLVMEDVEVMREREVTDAPPEPTRSSAVSSHSAGPHRHPPKTKKAGKPAKECQPSIMSFFKKR